MLKKAANESKQSIALAKNISEDLREVAENKVGELMSSLEKAANVAGQQVRDYYDKASSEATAATKAVKKQIKDKPIQSSLIALGAGFVLGLIFRR